jgi:hypothetical protein
MSKEPIQTIVDKEYHEKPLPRTIMKQGSTLIGLDNKKWYRVTRYAVMQRTSSPTTPGRCEQVWMFKTVEEALIFAANNNYVDKLIQEIQGWEREK